MPTPFDEVYKRFLNDKEDDVFVKMLPEDLDEKLYLYMEKAISLKFKQNKKELMNFNMVSKVFNIDLTPEEINIIALGMNVLYTEEQVSRQIKLQSRLGISVSNRDYKISPNSPTLKELQETLKKKEEELREAVITYTYSDFAGYK